jgi:hypothetical protein
LNTSRKSNKKCVKDSKQNCAGGGAGMEKKWSDEGRKTKSDMQERRNRHCVALVATGADEKKSNGADEDPEITTDRAPRRVKRCSVEESKTSKEKVRFAGRGKASSGKCGQYI